MQNLQCVVVYYTRGVLFILDYMGLKIESCSKVELTTLDEKYAQEERFVFLHLNEIVKFLSSLL